MATPNPPVFVRPPGRGSVSNLTIEAHNAAVREWASTVRTEAAQQVRAADRRAAAAEAVRDQQTDKLVQAGTTITRLQHRHDDLMTALKVIAQLAAMTGLAPEQATKNDFSTTAPEKALVACMIADVQVVVRGNAITEWRLEVTLDTGNNTIILPINREGLTPVAKQLAERFFDIQRTDNLATILEQVEGVADTIRTLRPPSHLC